MWMNTELNPWNPENPGPSCLLLRVGHELGGLRQSVSLSRRFCSPTTYVDAIQDYAEQVGRYESELGCLQTNNADDHTVDSGQKPTSPIALSDENGRDDGKNARNVIKTKHGAQAPLH